jgi:hypothetical protein
MATISIIKVTIIVLGLDNWVSAVSELCRRGISIAGSVDVGRGRCPVVAPKLVIHLRERA